MKKPILICAVDLNNVVEAKSILESFFEVRYIQSTIDALSDNLPKADAFFSSLNIQLTKDLIENACNLKVIATASTGRDHIDINSAKKSDVTVLSLKDDRKLLDNITSTAELAWALMLCCCRHLPAAVRSVRKGDWGRDLFRGHQLAHKTFGILGYGRLGAIVAEYARAFRMKVIACDKRPITETNIEQVCFNELLKQSDILSIHIHLTEENTGIINADAFNKMKPYSVLINTSRGAILDEASLLKALENGTLAAAGLDIVCDEWQKDLKSSPIIEYMRTHDNLIITPHIGGATYEAQEMAFIATAKKLVKYFQK